MPSMCMDADACSSVVAETSSSTGITYILTSAVPVLDPATIPLEGSIRGPTAPSRKILRGMEYMCSARRIIEQIRAMRIFCTPSLAHTVLGTRPPSILPLPRIFAEALALHPGEGRLVAYGPPAWPLDLPGQKRDKFTNSARQDTDHLGEMQ
eukprot:3217393-Pyramimonas_sp.AAC.1